MFMLEAIPPLSYSILNGGKKLFLIMILLKGMVDASFTIA
jgi:hypothetical protein